MVKHIFTILFLLCSAIASSQNQSLVVTLKDNTVKSFNISDIDSLTVVDNAERPEDSPVFANKISGIGNELKILAVGNSFTEDATMYLGELLESEGISKDHICIYTYILGGTSLEHWNGMINSQSNAPMHKVYGKEERFKDMERYTFDDVLNNDWDIIVYQQLSSMYYDTSTYEPYLSNLIANARKKVKGNVRIAWQMVWSRSSKAGEGKIYGDEGWANSLVSTKQTMANYDIDFLIPTGSAIHNARHTNICPKNDFTRDDQHLSYGAGRYMAAVTTYGSLIAPFFDKNIYRINFTYMVKDWEKNSSIHETMDVTADNMDVLLDCCAKAIISPYK